MNKLYAVVFDNDEEFPGVLQFCNVAEGDEFLQGAGTNITEDLEYAKHVVAEGKEGYPNLNYRVVEMIMQEAV